LENRAPDWVNADGSPRAGAPFDGNDLKTVELGLSGMRGLDESEERLLAASRLDEEGRVRQEEARQRELREARERAKGEAEEARAQAMIAREAARIAESRRVAALADAARPRRLELAMLLALEAVAAGGTLEGWGSLLRALDTRPEVVCFRRIPKTLVAGVA